MSIFEGSGVALITPFTDEGVDYNKLEKLLNWHVENHTDAILICGTTGEATTMTLEEKKKTIKFTVDIINKRIPVIAGTGSNNTQDAINMSKYAESVGVDAVLVITPYYNKTNKLGLFKHFEAINNAINIPIMLYNVPSRTNVNITPDILGKIATLSNVKAIKEASGDFSQIAKMMASYKDQIDFYSGNDDSIVPFISIGGKGVISVLANIIPNTVHDMTKAALNGDYKKAQSLQLDYLKLANNLFIETNPIPVKTALNLMGKKVGPLRLPLYEMDSKNEEILKNTLKDYNLI
ncbi:4-hydroxy-tetrahydrodipicolinate synthase [Clostridium sp. MSJ-8]|uniref:4-hydroxy-tetrahydrodipicolinate synthase n=1 Tax=Clostridium sp. MSJ-8 TaxID=2841510 RepID=UPI001C0EB656|nr:4-hydroxy-tetrahydrodipicolinate synthase [Clostridium sp. MSJ-8]MBU5488750.1 4-hydroxy-tetrahydrodipicolinate synthase [Clostridium sp. MSJ-8]